MPTWAELKERVITELDLSDEDFIDQEIELLEYANRAINKAESLILDLNEDYFLSEPITITLQSGVNSYSLPADIYANKIRMLFYDDGAKKYQIKKVKALVEVPYILSGDDFKYLMTNTYANGTKIRFYPTPQVDGGYVSMWYLRSSRPLELPADIVDLPEAYDYITQFIKDCVVNKERNTPDAPPSPALQKEEQVLISSLHQRTVDEPINNNDDLQFYNEV